MTPEEAVERINTVLTHAWMVRTFLKHAEEIQDDEELLDVPRTLFDSIRAVEPAYQRRDLKDYLRRIKGKVPKLRRVAELFAREFRRVSDHTNYQMAAQSLSGCVRELEEILAQVGKEVPVDGTDASADVGGSPEVE
jgi:archaellum component FlaC